MILLQILKQLYTRYFKIITNNGYSWKERNNVNSHYIHHINMKHLGLNGEILILRKVLLLLSGLPILSIVNLKTDREQQAGN